MVFPFWIWHECSLFPSQHKLPATTNLGLQFCFSHCSLFFALKHCKVLLYPAFLSWILPSTFWPSFCSGNRATLIHLSRTLETSPLLVFLVLSTLKISRRDDLLATLCNRREQQLHTLNEHSSSLLASDMCVSAACSYNMLGG